jgi:Zn-dependent protease with chaperone function
MLREALNFVKIGLKGRIMLSFAIVVSYTFFAGLPGMFKIIPLSCFIISSGVYFAIFIHQFVPSIRLSLDKKNELSIPMLAEVAELSKAIGTEIKEIKIRNKMCNAFVRGKTLVLGMELLKRLDPVECKAVVAHELGHIKGKHRAILFFCFHYDISDSSLYMVSLQRSSIHFDARYAMDG